MAYPSSHVSRQAAWLLCKNHWQVPELCDVPSVAVKEDALRAAVGTHPTGEFCCHPTIAGKHNMKHCGGLLGTAVACQTKGTQDDAGVSYRSRDAGRRCTSSTRSSRVSSSAKKH